MNGSDIILQVHNVCKSFPEGNGGRLKVLDSIDFSLREGESVAVVGNSGCGKSTLLEVCASLLRPESGEILFDGEDLGLLEDDRLSEIRCRKMGFVFQSSLLLGDFSALENVMMPGLLAGGEWSDAKKRAESLLASVGLGDRAEHRNDALSGGERQRVAVARALMNTPKIVFADEPTGSLDEENAAIIENLLFSLVKDSHATLFLATHNMVFARRCDRVLRLHDRILCDA
jgi:predicted ABC-type transport system involved in lysophospholipase L1 biosynthesis ATPase subunit